MKKDNITLGLDLTKNDENQIPGSRILDKSEISTKVKLLHDELTQLQKTQITDVYADFPTRLGRYVKIKLIKFTLNTLHQ